MIRLTNDLTSGLSRTVLVNPAAITLIEPRVDSSGVEEGSKVHVMNYAVLVTESVDEIEQLIAVATSREWSE